MWDRRSTIKEYYQRFEGWLKPRVALDRRALAIFRIGLGLIILADLALRFQDFSAHYTESGVLPSRLLPIASLSGSSWAPHLYVDSSLGVAMLFLLTAIAAIGLTLGIASRWMLLACWLLMHSLQLRNPYLNHAGDKLLMLMLFWSIFLPLDRFYRIRLRRTQTAPPSEPTFTSVASLGILLQLASVYVMGAIRKSGAMWQDGTAVWYVLQVDQYARPWTRALLEFPLLLKGITWTTWWIELLAPLLLFTGLTRWRTTGLLLIVLLQLGFFATLDLGLFPWISIVACLVAWPGPKSKNQTNEPTPAHRTHSLGFADNRIAAGLVVTLLVWNLLTLFQYPSDLKARLPRWAVATLEVLRFDQYWSMFAPNPMTIDGWYTITSRTDSGETLNLLNPSQPISSDKPINVSKSFPSDRWKEYLMTLTDLGDPPELWEAVATYLERQYRTTHAVTFAPDSTKIVYKMERTTKSGELPTVDEPAWPPDNN